MLTANPAADQSGQAPHRRSAAPEHRHAQHAAWIDIVAGLLCILPLLLTAHLPLTDLPNHLARQYIIRDWASSPYLQSFYYLHWDLVPNLALEVFVLAARQVMSIDLAVRSFCIATVVMLFLGTRLVNRGLSGGSARIYRFTPLLCYGGPFQFGFLSYCFGIGLGILLFGFYLRLRTRSPVAVAAFVAAAGFATLLCHLAAFGLFAVAVGASELGFAGIAAGGAGRRLLTREIPARLALPVCCLSLVMLIFFLLGPTSDENAAVNAARFAFRFSSLHEKARSIYAITLFASPWLEAGLLGLALMGLFAALVTRTIRLHRVGGAVVGAMLVVWMLLPSIALGSAFIDYRIPWAISFFLISGVVPASRYTRFRNELAGFFSVLAVARIGLIVILWLRWEPTLTALDGALAGVSQGARLMVVKGQLPGGRLFRQPDLDNVASYVVARRQAFEAGIFASVAGQILHFRPHYEALWARQNYGQDIPSGLNDLAPDYDYVLVLLPQYARVSPRLPLTCQASGPSFELLKVVRSGATAADQSSHCSKAAAS